MVIFTVSLTITQGALPVEDSVKVTEPFVISVGAIEYELAKLVLFVSKAPAPLVVHKPVPGVPVTIPLNAIVDCEEQMAWLGPALTVAISVILILTVSETGAQTPLLVEVSVKVTKPLAMSVAVIE